MMTLNEIISFLLTVLLAGVLGAFAMELSMWVMSRAGWAKGNMIVAVGSLLTRARSNAFRVGVIIHVCSGVVFATLYTLALIALGFTTLREALLAGLGIGFVHGMIVSLALVWVIADQHPLEEFREADLAIGLYHLVAHVVFGITVGAVVGVAMG